MTTPWLVSRSLKRSVLSGSSGGCARSDPGAQRKIAEVDAWQRRPDEAAGVYYWPGTQSFPLGLGRTRAARVLLLRGGLAGRWRGRSARRLGEGHLELGDRVANRLQRLGETR